MAKESHFTSKEEQEIFLFSKTLGLLVGSPCLLHDAGGCCVVAHPASYIMLGAVVWFFTLPLYNSCSKYSI
jgi:hypothetical protein